MIRPFFSVIMPICNTPAAYLSAAVHSVTEQTFTDIEILLVDDGSGEACAAQCDAFAAQDSRIRIIRQENAGVSAARNVGLENAKGAWILFVDADDRLETNACEYLRGQLTDTDCDMLIFGAVKEYGTKRQSIVYGLEPGVRYDLGKTETKEMFLRRLMQPPYSEGSRPYGLYFCWDKAYRRRFLAENGLRFTPGIVKSEDKLFLLECFDKADTVRYAEAVLYRYRINASSVCNRYSPTADRDRLRLIEKLQPMAERMDREMSERTGRPYGKLEKDLQSFIFAVTANVLLLKYYHPDNPDKKTRRRDAIAFVNSSPFKEAAGTMRYRELGVGGKLKKFMLRHNMVSTYCRLKRGRRFRNGQIAQEQ